MALWPQVGVLWKARDRTLDRYLLAGTITLDGVERRVQIFRNEAKLQPEQPDYIIRLVPTPAEYHQADWPDGDDIPW